MKKIQLVVEKREGKRSGACGRLRKQGLVPAVIYGHSGSKTLQVPVANFRKMMQEKGNSASLLELVCGSENLLAMLQDTQRNPRNDHYMHIDFKEIAPHETIRTTLPIVIVGEADGVKNFGGILEVAAHSINVECLPENLPEHIELNVEKLQIGESIHVSHLPQLKGVTFKTHPDVVLVSCVKADEEVEPASEEATEGETTEAATTEATSTEEQK